MGGRNHPSLHFVAAHVLVGKILQPLADILGVDFFGDQTTCLEVFNTVSSTKMGQSRRNARASASDGRESIEMVWPSRSSQMSA